VILAGGLLAVGGAYALWREGGSIATENQRLRVRLANALYLVEAYERRHGAIQVGGLGERLWGRVIARRGDHLVVTIGKSDGVQEGDLLFVRRGPEYVGQLRILRVYDDTSLCESAAGSAEPNVAICDEVHR